MKKTVTRYIPAGMGLHVNGDVLHECIKNNKSNQWNYCKKNQFNANENEITAEIETPEILTKGAVGLEQKVSLPLTTCKNKNLSDSTLSRNVNRINISNINSDTSSFEESDFISEDEMNNSSEVKTHADVSFKNKIKNQIKKYEKLKNSKAKAGLMSNVTHDGTEKIKNKSKVECQCSNCDGFVNCIAWCNNNIKFNESFDFTTRKSPPFLKTSHSNNKAKICKIHHNNLLIHGIVIPKPIDSLEKTCFNDRVNKALSAMKCSSAKNIQTYMWPAVQRGLNVFMVGPPKSGKTLSYLPALCTFVLEKSANYVQFSQYEGPLAVILCTNAEKCEDLGNLIHSLIEDCWDGINVKILTDVSSAENCDLLVTTPSILEKCLKSESVKVKRLCHLALEDSDLLLKNDHESLKKLFKILNEMQINRPHNRNIQIIVSSEKWTVDLEQLIKKIYVTPVTIFKDYVEAAVYSKITFRKKTLKSAHKRFYLEDILKKQYSTHRSIVFCNDHEIPDVCEYLEVRGIECISVSNDLIEDEIFENEDMWSSLKKGYYKVLLCTDTLFQKTARVVNANWLVHYSLPSNWATFQKRFRCLSAHLTSPLDNGSEVQENNCYFMLEVTDETCNEVFTDFSSSLARRHIVHFQ